MSTVFECRFKLFSVGITADRSIGRRCHWRGATTDSARLPCLSLVRGI